MSISHLVGDARIPVVVATRSGAGLASLLHKDPGADTAGVCAFGMLDQGCDLDNVLGGTHETLARAMHEEYVRQQARLGRSSASNPSMVPWQELPDDLKESNRRQADHIGVKLRAVGCAIAPLTDWQEPLFQFSGEEVERLARMEHERWVKERRAPGWKLGTKDLEKKTTPHLVPWEDLTEDVREIDRDFVRALPGILARAGFRIVRRPTTRPRSG
jgi:hypothetical protein